MLAGEFLDFVSHFHRIACLNPFSTWSPTITCHSKLLHPSSPQFLKVADWYRSRFHVLITSGNIERVFGQTPRLNSWRVNSVSYPHSYDQLLQIIKIFRTHRGSTSAYCVQEREGIKRVSTKYDIPNLH